MNRFHLRHEVGIEQFLDSLVEAAVEAGADRGKARVCMRGAVARNILQADICGIFTNCDDVKFFDPFVKIPQ